MESRRWTSAGEYDEVTEGGAEPPLVECTGGSMADQPKGYVDAAYLDLHKVLLDRAKKASYELLRLAPGHRVLDVGCGPATDTISLGRLVGPSGEVVGVDYDAEMIDEANRRAEVAGVGAWVQHRQADAAGLPFASNVFDAARS